MRIHGWGIELLLPIRRGWGILTLLVILKPCIVGIVFVQAP